MPVDRIPISRSQIAELIGVDPARFIAIERARRSTGFLIVVEPDEMQTSQTLPQLNTGKKSKGKKTVGGRTC